MDLRRERVLRDVRQGLRHRRGHAGVAAQPGADVNKPFAIKLASCPANAPGVVFLGTSKTSWSGLPLPLDLAFVGMPQCSLFTDGLVTFPVAASASGAATMGFPLPSDPALVGFALFNQAFLADPAANPTGLAASNVGNGVVGR